MFTSLIPNIMVENIEDTIAFYVNTLSFEIVTTVTGKNNTLVFVILKKDAVVIYFQEKESLVEEYETLRTDVIKPTFTLFFSVSNIDNFYKKLKSKVTLAKELQATEYTEKEFSIYDNNGIILTFAS
jgi:uncharacterized glyoxalase superfamily protein PhnB